MAQKAAKLTAKRNTEILNRTLLSTAVVHLVVLIIRAALFRSSFTKKSAFLYGGFSTPALTIQFWFERIGRPRYGKNPGEIRNPGEDLEAKGLTEWMWDVLYWTYGCLILNALFGDKAWWAWAAIPVYSVWLIYTSFFQKSREPLGLPSDKGTETRDNNALSRRQQKLEQRGNQKLHYR